MAKQRPATVSAPVHAWYECDRCGQIQLIRKQGPKEIEGKSRRCAMTPLCEGKLRIEITEAAALKRLGMTSLYVSPSSPKHVSPHEDGPVA